MRQPAGVRANSSWAAGLVALSAVGCASFGLFQQPMSARGRAREAAVAVSGDCRTADTAVFVLRLGADTGAVDRVAWNGDALTGAAVVARTMAVDYRVELGADGAVARYTFRLGPAPTVGDSVVFAAVAPGAAPTVVSRGRVPLWNAMLGLYDVLLRRAYALAGLAAGLRIADARGRATTVAVPLFRFGAASVRDTAVVTFVGADSARILLRTDGAPSLKLRARVGVGGRLLGLVAPTDAPGGWSVERADGLPRDAYAPAPAYGAPPGAPYAAEAVRLDVGGGVALAGTLTRPLDIAGPAPAVVLLHGSTPSDRNNGRLPLPGLFWQLADTLARRGITVLRYDQRGVGTSGGTSDSATVQVRAADARAALAYLASRIDVDPARTALLGLSEGALAAVLAVTESPALGAAPPVRAVVLMSSPGRPGRELSAYQTRIAAERYGGLAGPALAAALAAGRVEDDSLLRRGRGHAAALLAYDPLPAARRLRVPTLVVHGATDLQVPAEDAARVAAAIRERGNSDVTVRVFAGVDHVLLADPSGDWRRYLAVPSLVAPGPVRGLIADWLVAHLAAGVGAAGPHGGQKPASDASASGDRSPHQIRTVAVAPQVRVEVLDWGGPGPPLVFLPGLGDTGHVFDAFAARFRGAYRVYAITPRGFGASSHPEGGYDSETRARDVVAVLDSLGVRRAVLVGHSVAGDELSRVAVDYPDRVRALVYLDAYSYGTDYDTAAFPRTPRARAAWLGAATDSAPAARVLAGTRRAEYRRIRAPALAVYALHPSVRQLYAAYDAFDAEDRWRAEVNSAAVRRFQAAQIRRFRAEVQRGDVREISGAHHYVFQSDPDAVERAMRTFLARRTAAAARTSDRGRIHPRRRPS